MELIVLESEENFGRNNGIIRILIENQRNRQLK